MRLYQVRDYAGRDHERQLHDAQRNPFLAVRYCPNLDTARHWFESHRIGPNDAPTSRAADFLVVEVELFTAKDVLIDLLNGNTPPSLTRRAMDGEVYEVGPRGGLRKSEECDV